MLDVKQFLYAIESLNNDYIKLMESPEYSEGEKILHWKYLVKKHKIISSIPGFFKHRKASKYFEKASIDNINREEWERRLKLGNQNKRTVVFTCITGKYDKLKEPLIAFKNTDYILFTDNLDIIPSGSSWLQQNIPDEAQKYNAILENRYIKMHPFELFSDIYDTAIYIDGNVQPISDLSLFGDIVDPAIGIGAHLHRYRDCIYDEENTCELKGKGNIDRMRAQMDYYHVEGMPKHYGLIECTVMVTDLHCKMAKKIYQEWWKDLLIRKSMRDQLSLPYVLWKNNIKPTSIGCLGHNLYRDTKFRVYSH